MKQEQKNTAAETSVVELESKISYEYECFYWEQMRTSRENIFARSGEIETKKQLTQQLLTLASEKDENCVQLLCNQLNLLESFYRFYMDAKRQSPKTEMRDIREKWVSSLTEERDKNARRAEAISQYFL